MAWTPTGIERMEQEREREIQLGTIERFNEKNVVGLSVSFLAK